MKRLDFENYSSEYWLQKDWVFPFDQVRKNSEIAIYGAGDVGQAYMSQMEATGYCRISVWVDQNYASYREWGLEVKAPEELKNAVFDQIVIAVADRKLACTINEVLLGMGVAQEKIVWNGNAREKIPFNKKEFFVINPIKREIQTVLDYKQISHDSSVGLEYAGSCIKLAEDDNKIILPRIVVEMTTYCTLKCSGCNNLMPLYKKAHHLEADDIVKNFDRLLELTDHIMIVELIGGEPFIYPDLDKVLGHVLETDKVDIIEITTNGTIVPKEGLINLMRNPKVIVRISKYSASNKLDQLVDILSDNNIRYQIMEELVWTDSGEPISNGKSVAELQNNYIKCGPARFCRTLFGDKLFCCARAASLYDLDMCKEDTFVSLTGEDAREELKKAIYKDYSIACDYCNATDEWRAIEAGVQTSQ